MIDDLDKDRLDENVLQVCDPRVFYRGRGITTAHLYLMLGEVWGGDAGNVYAYVSPFPKQHRDLEDAFIRLIEMHSDIFVVRHTRGHIALSNGQLFIFSTPYIIGDRDWLGKHIARVFSDVGVYHRDYVEYERLVRNCKLYQTEIIG